MKKIYTCVFALALISGGVLAQSNNNNDINQLDKKATTTTIRNGETTMPVNAQNKDAQIEIWSDDFSDPTTWDIDHDATACSLDWEIGIGLECGGFAPIISINSTTSGNGYAMVDSDEYGGENGGSEIEDSWITTAESIDLSAYPNVILEFETQYYRWTYEECFVVISTTNTDWPELDPDFDASTDPNVFVVWPGMETQDAVDNPTLKRINISEAAGNESQVWVRFHWTGTWGYAWFVDDVKILEQAANDMVMEYGVISHNSTGDEYGRVPSSQLNPEMGLGALTSNFGFETQTDVIVDILIEDEGGSAIVETSSDPEATLEPDSLFSFDTDEAISVLEPGLYTTTFTVTSAEEQDGDQFENNVEVRNFEITTDVYSLDGIGVHELANIGTMGTNSFTDDEDGFFMMNLYDLNQEENEVFGVEILLSSLSVEGGSIIAHLLDSNDVYQDNIDNPLVSSDEVLVTQDMIDAGSVMIYFDASEVLAANAYFAGVELFSNGGDNHIRLLNDRTIPQPPWSSVIFSPTDLVTYTNPNALGIRLLMSGADAVDELVNDAILGSIAPNPARDQANVTFELVNATNVKIRVTDMLGKTVILDNVGALSTGSHSHMLNLSELEAGSYHYSIITDNTVQTKAFQIIK